MSDYLVDVLYCIALYCIALYCIYICFTWQYIFIVIGIDDIIMFVKTENFSSHILLLSDTTRESSFSKNKNAYVMRYLCPKLLQHSSQS